MSRRSDEQLIHDLARDITPVRRIPPLRGVVATLALLWVAGLWTVGFARIWGFGPPLTDVVAGAAWNAPAFALVWLGLLGIAAGATLAALAGAVPGREGVVVAGVAAAAVGLGLAVGGGLWAVIVGAGAAVAPQLATGAGCVAKACALGLAPLGGAAFFLARGFVRRPWRCAGLAVMGAVALGGVAIHVGCDADGALHLLFGHALAPLLLGFALAVPVGYWIRR